MKIEEKQALIVDCEAEINNLEWRICQTKETGGSTSYLESCLKRQQIALAALTAQPVISDDTKRMDWLCAHCVEVRYPLMYGSREMFRAQQDSEEWDLPHHTTLREQVDAAIANEVQE
ncbi:unnamed protein product [Nesidiocoris tenuis]|uniref:Uncharacterized protein n=1 Tax=Nesidiocoris tenuis TaxID=355587 RepID=A0A6H5GSM5_9HEMI|nr:unnamed protein product [Nesidiocoris tenuis]